MSDYNYESVFVAGTDDPIMEAMNLEMAKLCTDHLMRLFPGYLWAVNSDIKNGVVNILNYDVSTVSGFRLLLTDLADPSTTGRELMLAGGEILERAGFNRGKMKEDEVATAVRDVRGNVITKE